MPLFLCRVWQGEPTAMEGQTLAWAHADEIDQYAMPPADIGLKEAFKKAL